MAVVAMFQPPLNKDKIYGHTDLSSFLTTLTAGYFCTETLIICRNYKEHGLEPLTHAAVCVAFFITCAVQRKLHWFVPRVLFFECSTPLVHMRWLLASLGMGHTRLYKANGIAMISAFFLCRVVWGTSAPPTIYYCFSLCCACGSALNCLWLCSCTREQFTFPCFSFFV